MSDQQQRDNRLAERLAPVILQWLDGRIERSQRREREPASDETQIIALVQSELRAIRAEEPSQDTPNDGSAE